MYKWRKNAAAIICTSIDVGVALITRRSRCSINADLGVLSIVSLTIQRDTGTVVSGYDKTSSMLIFFFKDMQRILPGNGPMV